MQQQSNDPAIRDRAIRQARSEAWSLLATYGRTIETAASSSVTHTGHGPRPEWESWDTKCQLDLSRLCNLVVATQSTNKDNPRFSTVYYNRKASEWIQKSGFASSSTLRDQLNKGLSNLQPAGPETAAIVKEIWVSFNSDEAGADTRIPIYDPDLIPDTGTLGDPASWNNSIKILRTWSKNKTGRTSKVDEITPCKAGSYQGAERDEVPVNCFVHQSASRKCSDLIQYVPNVHSTQGETALPARPCIAILVGFHIMTLEMANWTWNTFWWTNMASGDEFRNDRPVGLPPAFTHLAMNTMLSPASGEPSLPAKIFNPYLEGPQTTTKRCLGCHFQAAYTPTSPTADPGKPRDGTTDPQNHIGDTANQPHIRTAFLWSLTTNQDANTDEPTILFTHLHFIPGAAGATSAPRK